MAKSKKTKNKSTSKRQKKQRKAKINAPSEKKILFWSIVGVLIALIIILASTYTFSDRKTECLCNKATAKINTTIKTNDPYSLHLQHAHVNGIKHPIKNEIELKSSIDSLISNDIIEKVTPSRFYNIRPLTLSYPYLTPEANNLLKTIGKQFQQNLRKENLPIYKFQISSILRTIDFQQQLTNTKENITPNESSHYYATTFDIAYDKFDRRGKSITDPKITAILEKTLIELRSECKLLVSREPSKKCYHITVVCLLTQ